MIFNWGKKKLKPEEVARMFVHATLDSVEDAWPEVLGLMRETPHMERPPEIDETEVGPFLLVVLAGNLDFIPQFFELGSDQRIVECILAELAVQLDLPINQLAQRVGHTRDAMVKLNKPSKKTLSAMARGIYLGYELNDYQEDYFRSLGAPNPRFLMQMEEILQHFLWDWTSFHEQYRLQTQTQSGVVA
jgi:hypothetical protein